jgi:hypothetical protein
MTRLTISSPTNYFGTQSHPTLAVNDNLLASKKSQNSEHANACLERDSQQNYHGQDSEVYKRIWELHAKRWTDITKSDLEAFVAVLFIFGIQKQKDKEPSLTACRET